MIKRLACAFMLSLAVIKLTNPIPCFAHSVVTDQKQEDSLNGIKTIMVTVNVGFSLDGPTNRLFQNEVERIISQTGLVIKPKSEVLESESLPSFCVDVSVFKESSNSYIFFIIGRLNQKVLLVRDGSNIGFATTWTVGAIGSGGTDQMLEKVQDVTEAFARDYNQVNSFEDP